ncbi:MAG TPA: ATP-dependent helicase, partial [archaeon]|nr:ATP-dependent helicase [archaeon]
YLDVSIRTFHAFGDQLLREHAPKLGLSLQCRVLSKAEQLVFLRQRVFELPLEALRPANDPTRFLDALAAVFARAKDEAAGPEEYMAYAQELGRRAAVHAHDEALVAEARRTLEIANTYAAYQQLLRQADAVDFGDQVALALQLLEQHPDVLAAMKARFRFILVDEFQDTNYAQFRLLQLLASPTANVTVVGDDDQSIYKWRGAAISNVVKFLDHYASVRTVVLTENFRSSQAILDCAYRLIRFNDPDRLEVRQGIDKKLLAHAALPAEEPHLRVFDSASSEADWVARTIREIIEPGLRSPASRRVPRSARGERSEGRRPGDVAILVRSNREADLFLRALNVAGIPWRFSGASGLFAREESKMLLS